MPEGEEQSVVDIEERIRIAQERAKKSAQIIEKDPEEAKKWGITEKTAKIQGEKDEAENPSK